MKFIFFVVMICSVFSGCSVGIKGKVWNNLAEIVDFVVCGKNDNIMVDFMCGRRESEYKINGFANELIPYGIITVNLLSEELKVVDLSYILYVGTNKYSGKMEKNPYDNSWVADIKKVVDKSENISVDLYINEIKYSLKLTSIDNDWDINVKDVINNVLVKQYKDKLKQFVNKGEFEGEVYIKLINDYDNYSSCYYYYVLVYGRDGKCFSFLLSPKTSEILASNLSAI